MTCLAETLTRWGSRGALALVAVGGSLDAQGEVLFSTGFEPPYVAGALQGQQGWLTQSTPATTAARWEVVGSRFASGTRSAWFDTRLVGGSHWAWQNLNFQAEPAFEVFEVESTWWTVLNSGSVNPSLFGIELYALPSQGGGRIAFGYLDAGGRVAVVANNQTYATPTRATSNQWNRLVLRLDTRTQTTRLVLNGVDVGIEAPLSATTVGQVNLRASALGFDQGWVDDLEVRRLPWRVPVTGRVVLDDWTGGLADLSVRVRIRPSLGGSQEEHMTTLDAQGNFRVLTGHLGAVDVRVKVGHWLTELTSVTTTGAGRAAGTFRLTNGDVDGDDTVSVFDYDGLSRHFDRSSTDADWGTPDASGVAPRDADLDGDLTVSVFDYDILSKNFDRVGE